MLLHSPANTGKKIYILLIIPHAETHTARLVQVEWEREWAEVKDADNVSNRGALGSVRGGRKASGKSGFR